MLYGGKIEFKTATLEAELLNLHPAARAALGELAAELPRRGLRHAVVTDLLRTEAQQTAIYGDNRFSWHKKATAWDVRVKGGGEQRYAAQEASDLVKWLRANWPDAEVYLHGQPKTGDNVHIHFAVRLRDFR